MPDPELIESGTLNIGNCALALAFSAIVAKVKADPILSPVVKRWESSPYQFDPTVIKFLPLVIVECGTGPIESRAASMDDSFLQITFSIHVANGNHVDMLNLDRAIRKAIRPRDADWLQEAIGETGILAGIRWKQGAGTYKPIMPTKVLQGVAVLEIQIGERDCDLVAPPDPGSNPPTFFGSYFGSYFGPYFGNYS